LNNILSLCQAPYDIYRPTPSKKWIKSS
jgi:hypothetical protein